MHSLVAKTTVVDLPFKAASMKHVFGDRRELRSLVHLSERMVPAGMSVQGRGKMVRVCLGRQAPGTLESIRLLTVQNADESLVDS